MNERIDFRPLESLADEWNGVKANDLFQDYLKKLEKYLDIAPIDKQVSISMVKRKNPKEITAQNVYGAWVDRDYSDKGLELTIFEECGKLLPYVLLRELYNCFLAKHLKSYELVQHAVNVVLVEDASFGKHRLQEERTREWRNFIDETRRQKEQELERIEGYFIDDTLHQQVLRHLFWYLQGYEELIKEKTENLSTILFQVYWRNTLKLLFEKNGQIDLVEALRCLHFIFNSVKQYRALLEYEKYFQEFKNNGTLKTDLSLNKFKNSMKQIKHTVISPSYKTNWGLLGIDITFLIVKLNPALKPSLVEKIVQNWEFAYLIRRFCFSGSSEMFIGVFLPQKYYRDLNNYFRQLKELGYVLSFSIGRNQSFTVLNNLNRYFNDPNGLINPKNPRFDHKYLFSKEIDYQIEAERSVFPSIVDFLILDRIPMYSITGLGFERRAEQLQVLNNDLKKEISNQLGLLKRFEKSFLEIVKSKDIKKKFAAFIEKHRLDGFFHVKEVLSTLLVGLKFVKDLDSLYPDFKSVSQFQALLKSNKLSSRFEENLIFTNRNLKEILTHKFLPLYFQSKGKFNKFKMSSSYLEHFRRENVAYEQLSKYFKLITNIYISGQFDFGITDLSKFNDFKRKVTDLAYSTLTDSKIIERTQTSKMAFESICLTLTALTNLRYHIPSIFPRVKFNQKNPKNYYTLSDLSEKISAKGSTQLLSDQLRSGAPSLQLYKIISKLNIGIRRKMDGCSYAKYRINKYLNSKKLSTSEIGNIMHPLYEQIVIAYLRSKGVKVSHESLVHYPDGYRVDNIIKRKGNFEDNIEPFQNIISIPSLIKLITVDYTYTSDFDEIAKKFKKHYQSEDRLLVIVLLGQKNDRDIKKINRKLQDAVSKDDGSNHLKNVRIITSEEYKEFLGFDGNFDEIYNRYHDYAFNIFHSQSKIFEAMHLQEYAEHYLKGLKEDGEEDWIEKYLRQR